MVSIKGLLMAGLGGFAGTAGRYAVVRVCSCLFPGFFPWGTLGVNLIGCFLFGLITGLLEHYRLLGSAESVLLLVGFCGGFTTFSTFAGDMLSMGTKGEWVLGAAYLGVSVLVGVFLVWAGKGTARLLL